VSDAIYAVAALVATGVAFWVFDVGGRAEANQLVRLLQRFADGSGLRRRAAEDPSTIVLVQDDVPVTVGMRRTEAAEGWGPVLYARARWALGRGPSFVAAPDDETSFAQPASGTVTLRARVERAYALSGQHREAKRLLVPVLERTRTDLLTTPRFLGTDDHVIVELPGLPLRDAEPTRAAMGQLVVLVARLALSGIDKLRPFAEALGGRVLHEPGRTPPLHARFRRSGIDAVLELEHDAGLGAVRLSARPQRPPLPVDEVIASLGPKERQDAARQLLRRAQVTSARERVVIRLAFLPDLDDLRLLADLLVGLAGAARRPGPFR
jgi:hypothetical protein